MPSHHINCVFPAFAIISFRGALVAQLASFVCFGEDLNWVPNVTLHPCSLCRSSSMQQSSSLGFVCRRVVIAETECATND
mmetsp:Transcript_20706/g.57550  ORF Transcript_20706/g.57550 Transcript_20706/m.57550 type:complete len:80 (+) Transcript_20706:731-970(+)